MKKEGTRKKIILSEAVQIFKNNHDLCVAQVSSELQLANDGGRYRYPESKAEFKESCRGGREMSIGIREVKDTTEKLYNQLI